MSSYKRTEFIKVEFDGDIATMDIIRFNNEDMIKLGPYLFTENVDEGELMRFESGVKSNQIAVEVLPSKISNFHGLKDAAGVELTVEDVLNDPVFFMTFILEILGEIFALTHTSKVTVKKLEGQSGQSLGVAPATKIQSSME